MSTRTTGRRILWGFVDAAGSRIRIIRREADLFLGSALFFLGLLGFESDRYCDGNPADYLSCTRPTTFYYFDLLDIALIVAGVFFILFWLLHERKPSEG